MTSVFRFVENLRSLLFKVYVTMDSKLLVTGSIFAFDTKTEFDCINVKMTRLNEKLIKEQYEKAERYFRVHDNYCPNYRRSAVTSKFYSRVDALDLSTADDELVRKIKIFRDKGPKNKFAWPETENMRYGWFSEPLVRFDRNDERLYFPVREDETTRHDIKLVNDKSMKLEKFGGVPFKLK